jgi:hypothetical protein
VGEAESEMKDVDETDLDLEYRIPRTRGDLIRTGCCHCKKMVRKEGRGWGRVREVGDLEERKIW